MYELNPIELVWAALVQRLKIFPLNFVRQIGANGVAFAAHCILLGVTHKEVTRMYNHSGLIVE